MIRENPQKTLEKRRSDCIANLKEKRKSACEDGIIFDGRQFDVLDKTTNNVALKRSCVKARPHRFKFADKEHRVLDLQNNTKFQEFHQEIFDRKDFIMFYYNELYLQILDSDEPESITIDFTQPEE